MHIIVYSNDRVDFYEKFENPIIRVLIVEEFWRDYVGKGKNPNR